MEKHKEICSCPQEVVGYLPDSTDRFNDLSLKTPSAYRSWQPPLRAFADFETAKSPITDNFCGQCESTIMCYGAITENVLINCPHKRCECAPSTGCQHSFTHRTSTVGILFFILYYFYM